jgi:hypothetical protein
LARAGIAKAACKIERGGEAAAFLRDRWPDVPIAPIVLRAASEPPASLPATPALGRSIVADIIATVGPVGAGARLPQAASLALVFDGAATINVPALQATASAGSFCGESMPIPVTDLDSPSVPSSRASSPRSRP